MAQEGFLERILGSGPPPEYKQVQRYATTTDRAKALEAAKQVAPVAASDGLVARIHAEGGTYHVDLVRNPAKKDHKATVQIVLFIVTAASMTLAGAGLAHPYFGGPESDGALEIFLGPEWLGMGFVFFALPLLGILVAHEWAHHFVAHRRRVDSTWPYFLPVPFLSPSGTFGAIIGLRGRLPDRRALLEVGVSGPLVGFVAAVIVVFIGEALAAAQPSAVGASTGPAAETVLINVPLIVDAITALLQGLTEDLHPTTYAGAFGLFVTSVQLLPVGQLDGGHVARAVLGPMSRWVGLAVVAGLLVLGIVTSFVAWFVLAFALLFMGVRPATPLDDVTSLPPGHIALAVSALVVFVVSFVPTPLQVL